jgi:hypothetical protein
MPKAMSGFVSARATAKSCRAPDQRAQQPVRTTEQQQWRHDQREQEMLHHVRAEKEVVGELVERPMRDRKIRAMAP